MFDDHDVRLAQEMEKVGYPPHIVQRARKGHWSDFKTPLATPKMELVAMLTADGHTALADRVAEGEFDG